MALTLSLTAETSVPIEVEGLIPSAVAGRSLAEIERAPVFHGKHKVALAEMFRLSGDADDGRMVWQGDLAGVHWIAAHLDGGEVRVEGSAGRHVGSQMTVGNVTVEGDAGDWVGGEMRGGRIEVRGRARHLAGAAYRGSPRGMTGGEILIYGPAGNEIGHSMRRGLIAVGGAGDAAGVNLIAGSILVFGPCGIRPGANMRRGTIGLFGPESPRLLPTFRRACRLRPPWMPIVLSHLASSGYPVPEGLATAELALFHGDLVALGRGEVLVNKG